MQGQICKEASKLGHKKEGMSLFTGREARREQERCKQPQSKEEEEGQRKLEQGDKK